MMTKVRTTVTLDADVAAMLTRLMAQKRLGFKAALNAALRLGLSRANAARAAPVTPLPTFDLGLRGDVNLDKALQLASELEDEEVVRESRLGR